MPPWNKGEGDGDSFAGKEVWNQSKDPQGRSRPPLDNSNSSSPKEMVCHDVEAEWNVKTRRKRNSPGESKQPGKGPENPRRKQPGEGPSTSPLCDQGWQEAGKMSLTGGLLQKEEKCGGDNRQREMAWCSRNEESTVEEKEECAEREGNTRR